MEDGDQQQDVEQEIKERAVEDYDVFEKFWIILFWPRELIMHGWGLRRDGYITKAENRIKLIGIGVILYAITLLLLHR